MRRIYRIFGILWLANSAMHSQWLHHWDKGIPRFEDGRPNLGAPVAIRGNNAPDLSGIWQAEPDPNGTRGNVENDIPPKYFVSVVGGLNPGKVPMQPWAEQLFRERLATAGKDAPWSACKPLGTPQRAAYPAPFKIVQSAELILLLYEQDTTFRQVFMDGRRLPGDPQPSWLGYSVGRWEGDTLVIETNGFRENGWLDAMGHPHSDALHMTERFRRIDVGHMMLEVLFSDPKAYTAPVRFTQPLLLLPDTDLLESFCPENEKDQQHLRGN
jgi:hypothetical protein